jgi:TonB family protein
MGRACGWLTLVTVVVLPLSATAVAQVRISSTEARELGNVRLSSREVMPSVVERVLPAYPATQDLRDRERVDVEIEVVVSTRGRVIQTRIAAAPSGEDEFAREAERAASAWRFRAATRYGERVPSLVILTISARPSSSLDEPPAISADVNAVRRSPLPSIDRSLVGDLYDDETSGIEDPRPIRRVTPEYTSAAMRAIVQGMVEMDVVILADGTIGDARVRKSLDVDLDHQALVAARYWLFDPARLNGRNVAMRATLVLEFRLH